MKLQETGNSRGGYPYAQNMANGINEIRRNVICGDWSAVNNRVCTLTDLGLRHNGQGLVWLRSGVPVREADSDTGFSGKAKVSHEYHESLCPSRPADNKGFIRGVHSHKVDGYCLNILTSSPSWIEYWHRRDGKALSTFAVQVLTNERQEAFDDWVIYRSPAQPDKYTVINTVRNSSTVKEYQRLGWVCESAHELSLLVKNDAEFSRLMGRLGYVKIRTRKITGRKEAFWIYRSAEKGLSAAEKQPLMDASYSDVVKRISRGKQEVCPEGAAPHKASEPFVQVSHKPRYGYNEVAVDGKLLHVYGDHIRLLTKKRVRVNGKQVQGYTAKGLRVEVVG